MQLQSYFAAPERAQYKDIQESSSFLQGKQEIASVFNTLQEYALILNRQRQILFINDPFIRYLGGKNKEDIIGKRPGELIGCIYSSIMDAGCGTARQCRLCGAAQAITECIEKGKKIEKECSITARDQESFGLTGYEFRVNAMPFTIENRSFFLLTFIDISHQKRKTALERTFFHDILNTASSIRIYCDLLRRSDNIQEKNKITDDLSEMISSLIEEINSQKLLVNAENGTLKSRHDLIAVYPFIKEIIRRFALHSLWKNRIIEVEQFSEDFSCITDQTILGRVIVNKLKNALEETSSGEKVTIGFSRDTASIPGNSKIWVKNPFYMPEGIQQQIFRRSFSTKGENRGLGTYSMKLLTENYLKGTVSFVSTPEEGTVFTVTIPDLTMASEYPGNSS